LKRIRVALVGNPNAGKTALLNALAGTSEKVGNWPGVTVEKRIARYPFRGFEIEITDLPGIYSLNSYTLEERITRNSLRSENYDSIVNVLDATSLGRNLYLTLELLELGLSPIVVLNKIDEVSKKGFTIDREKLREILGLPVVEVSSLEGRGLQELSELILRAKPNAGRLRPKYSAELEELIGELEKKISLPLPRWLAIKALERDSEVLKELQKLPNWKEIEEFLKRAEKEVEERHSLDLPTFVARERFFLASKIAASVVRNFAKLPMQGFEEKLDRLLTSPLTGIPIFFFAMWLLFKITFSLSEPIGGAIDALFSQTLPEFVSKIFSAAIPPFLLSLFVDAILPGVGAVLTFLPVLFFLYLFMAILEDSGYMARAAALWDNFMKRFGLSGASVIPMILGFGCNVPAIYATRAMRSPLQKLTTMLVIPWISCSARLTVFAVFTAAFFRENRSLVLLFLYSLGVLAALLFALIYTRAFGRREEEEFFIELPPYRVPSLKIVLNQTLTEVKEFLRGAATVIVMASALIWLLASLPPQESYAGEGSLLGKMGKLLVPLFSPIGIEDWKPIVALISGAVAKEVVLGTLGALMGGGGGVEEGLKNLFTPASALSFMVFTLLYIPCVATMAAIRQESGSWRYPLLLSLVQLSVAWVSAFIVYRLARAILC